MRCYVTVMLLLVGCAEDLKPDNADVFPASGKVVAAAEGAVFAVQVDARDEADWIGVDLAAGEDGAGAEADPQTAHLAFRRVAVRVGPGVEAAVVAEGEGEAGFLALTRAPATAEWAAEPADQGDDPVGRDRPAGPLGGWFDYDPRFHTLSPADHSYALRTAQGECFKLRLRGYYDDAGTSAMIGFAWGPLEGCR